MESQLSGEEILWNLPGTVEEKEALHNTCALGCHSFQQIFKNRYDERSWGVLVARMLHRGGGPLINDPLEPISESAQATDRMLIKWLAKVRGPDAVDGPMYAFPRLTGESNRVVVTEFELPRALQSAHDVYGDGNGNIWYTSHLSRFFGKLDTRTGIVTEYQTPLTPGAQPGTHHVYVEKNGEVLISEPWSHKLLKLDPRNGEMVEVPVAAPFPINSAGMADFDVTPDGFVWASMGGGYAAEKIDPKTGNTVQKYPMKVPFSYDGVISQDGNFWAGGAISGHFREFRRAAGYPNGADAQFGFRRSAFGWTQRGLRSIRQRLVWRRERNIGGAGCQSQTHPRILSSRASRALHGFILRGTRQEWRSVGRRIAWTGVPEIQSANGAMDGIRDARALFAFSRRMGR